MAINQFRFTGNVVAPAEIRTLPGGKRVGELRLAFLADTKKSGGEREFRSEFIRLIAWEEKIGELNLEKFAKGMKIYAEGKLVVREYTGKDGKLNKAMELHYPTGVREFNESPDSPSVAASYGDLSANPFKGEEIPF